MDFVHVELKRDWVQPAIKIQTPDDAIDAVQKVIDDFDREMVVCIYMATSGRVISASVCAIGTVDGAMISPAEIMRTALLTGCRSIILLHNHPSGNAEPSREDIETTKRIHGAGELIGIQLLDHIVIGDSRRCSIKERHPDIFERRKVSWDVIANEARGEN